METSSTYATIELTFFTPNQLFCKYGHKLLCYEKLCFIFWCIRVFCLFNFLAKAGTIKRIKHMSNLLCEKQIQKANRTLLIYSYIYIYIYIYVDLMYHGSFEVT